MSDVQKDLTVKFGGHKSILLFSKKTSDDGHVIAQIEVEANNNEQAWVVVASNFLPPILDALSFATGTPLLLRDCELILKDEAGKPKRRVLYIGHRHVPSVAHLQDVEIEEMKTILATGDDLRLPLCRYRDALDRELAHEQFVFNWLAFEALAGDTDVPSRCPNAMKVETLDRPVVHRGSSKIAARWIFQAAHPQTTDQEFNNEFGARREIMFFTDDGIRNPSISMYCSRTLKGSTPPLINTSKRRWG